jgi:hypothetical protein
VQESKIKMIRIIVDKLGSGHHDLFLKIDTIPDYSKTADSYYLFDFLEISDSEFEKLNLKEDEILKYGTVELLKYWIDRIKHIEKGQRTFIPFDLWDEYIGGLLLEKTKLGFKTKIVYSDKIHGYGVSKSNLDNQIADNNVNFIEEGQAEWLIGEEALFNGLYWSIKELTNKN